MEWNGAYVVGSHLVCEKQPPTITSDACPRALIEAIISARRRGSQCSHKGCSSRPDVVRACRSGTEVDALLFCTLQVGFLLISANCAARPVHGGMGMGMAKGYYCTVRLLLPSAVRATRDPTIK